MAFGNYSELKTSIASWMHRGDLSTVLSDFVALGEARMNRDLLIAERFAEETGTIADPFLVPDDYWSAKELSLVSGAYEYPLKMVSLEQIAMYKGGGTTTMFAEFNGEFLLAPAASGSYVLRYYAKIPALSDSNTTNWLLTKYPDIYLWASLAEASIYAQNDARGALWEGKYQQSLSAILADNDARRFGGSTLQMRSAV